MRVKLRRGRGTAVLAIPRMMLEELHLTPDASVELSIHAGSLVVRPARRRYSLEELLAQCDPDAAPAKAEREWVDAPAVGDEIAP
jgi:antitoxin ChpS